MTTTLSGHGTRVGIRAPARSAVVEADELFYR
jgi:hypothetical protein